MTNSTKTSSSSSKSKPAAPAASVPKAGKGSSRSVTNGTSSKRRKLTVTIPKAGVTAGTDQATVAQPSADVAATLPTPVDQAFSAPSASTLTTASLALHSSSSSSSSTIATNTPFNTSTLAPAVHHLAVQANAASYLQSPVDLQTPALTPLHTSTSSTRLQPTSPSASTLTGRPTDSPPSVRPASIATSPATDHIMSTALKNRYLWFLHLHHHPAALDHVCTLGIARHITALNAPLRWRSRVLNIEKMLELIRKAGGPSRVPSWRYLAERLGFDCQVATSMACRLKKFVYEHHFDVFLETTLDTDTDWSRVYCGVARGSCDDDKATEHVRPSCKVSVSANDGDDKVAAGVQEPLKEATQGSSHVPIRSPTMTTANATTTADITTSADITSTSTSTNMDQNNACADEHDNSASANPVYEPQANPYHQPGTPPPIFHPSIAVALPFAYHSQATTHPAMPPISPGTWSQLHALWWPHLHHPHHPHPYYTADQFSALASQHQILDRNGGRVCGDGRLASTTSPLPFVSR